MHSTQKAAWTELSRSVFFQEEGQAYIRQSLEHQGRPLPEASELNLKYERVFLACFLVSRCLFYNIFFLSGKRHQVVNKNSSKNV